MRLVTLNGVSDPRREFVLSCDAAKMRFHILNPQGTLKHSQHPQEREVIMYVVEPEVGN